MTTNNKYQRDLAQALVQSLGVEQAIEICRRNQWDGVLELIDKKVGNESLAQRALEPAKS